MGFIEVASGSRPELWMEFWLLLVGPIQLLRSH